MSANQNDRLEIGLEIRLANVPWAWEILEDGDKRLDVSAVTITGSIDEPIEIHMLCLGREPGADRRVREEIVDENDQVIWHQQSYIGPCLVLSPKRYEAEIVQVTP